MDTRELLSPCLWAPGETMVLARLGCSGSKTNLTYNFKRNQATLVFVFQTSILALMSFVRLLESARHTVHMKHAACVSKTAPPIRTQYALRVEQHTTTNAGKS